MNKHTQEDIETMAADAMQDISERLMPGYIQHLDGTRSPCWLEPSTGRCYPRIESVDDNSA